MESTGSANGRRRRRPVTRGYARYLESVGLTAQEAEQQRREQAQARRIVTLEEELRLLQTDDPEYLQQAHVPGLGAPASAIIDFPEADPNRRMTRAYAGQLAVQPQEDRAMTPEPPSRPVRNRATYMAYRRTMLLQRQAAAAAAAQQAQIGGQQLDPQPPMMQVPVQQDQDSLQTDHPLDRRHLADILVPVPASGPPVEPAAHRAPGEMEEDNVPHPSQLQRQQQ